MKKPEMILAAHRSGKIDLHKMSLKAIAKHFGCGEATACLARQRARDEDGVEPPKFGWQVVIDAHNDGRVNLLEQTDKDVGEILSVHHSVAGRARRELGIKREGEKKEDPYAWYWYRWRKKYGVFKKWGVLPERRGYTRLGWKKWLESA